MNSELLHITKSTHNFCVSRLTPRARNAVLEFTKQNVLYGLVRLPGGRFVNSAVKVFASATLDRQEFRFHINQYKEFKDHLAKNYITDNLIVEFTKPIDLGVDIEIIVQPGWVAKEDQNPVIDYLEADSTYRSKFVDLQTGGGKTFCALKAIAKFHKRTLIIVKPMYIDKWVGDLLKTYEVSVKDIMVVKGAIHLQAIIAMAQEGTLDVKFIIIGNKTIQNYLKLYELERSAILSDGYGCLPEDFFSTLGVGMLLKDEVHQDFHLNFKIDLYTNINRSIALSATLLNNDQFIERMYKIAYPHEERYSGTPLKKYVLSTQVFYNLHPSTRLQTTEFNSHIYSHNAFERSVLRNHLVRDRYFQMVWNTFNSDFIADYKKGQKGAVFCSSIEFCTQMAKYFQVKYPDLDVRRYVGEDPPENLHEPDIRVTTILSGGTAHDISNLKVVVLTVGVDSIQANIQTLGRLRMLPDSNTYFLYLTCRDIPKQVDYGDRKRKMLEIRAASYREINAPFLI